MSFPPGAKAWPFHYHTANEEAIYVLEGTGLLRTATDETSIRAGDYVALPIGADYARRVINDGDHPLRYLCHSTLHEPEIAVYPDSGKIGAFAGAPPGEEADATISTYLALNAAIGYWEGE